MLEIAPPRWRLIGHRGAQDTYPENTIAGCEAAAAFGLDWIEVDLQLTACGHWVVIHDLSLERTTNGKGLVRTKTLEELALLRIQGIHPIPSLSALIAALSKYSVTLNLELKILPEQQSDAMTGVAKIIEHWPLSRPPYFSSFNHTLLNEIRASWPQYAIGYLADYPTLSLIKAILPQSNVSLNCQHSQLTLEEVQVLSKKISLLTYTVNDIISAQTLIGAGIFGIFTDEATMLRNALYPPLVA